MLGSMGLRPVVSVARSIAFSRTGWRLSGQTSLFRRTNASKPESTSFGFIGRVESLAEDWQRLLKLWPPLRRLAEQANETKFGGTAPAHLNIRHAARARGPPSLPQQGSHQPPPPREWDTWRWGASSPSPSPSPPPPPPQFLAAAHEKPCGRAYDPSVASAAHLEATKGSRLSAAAICALCGSWQCAHARAKQPRIKHACPTLDVLPALPNLRRQTVETLWSLATKVDAVQPTAAPSSCLRSGSTSESGERVQARLSPVVPESCERVSTPPVFWHAGAISFARSPFCF